MSIELGENDAQEEPSDDLKLRVELEDASAEESKSSPQQTIENKQNTEKTQQSWKFFGKLKKFFLGKGSQKNSEE